MSCACLGNVLEKVGEAGCTWMLVDARGQGAGKGAGGGHEGWARADSRRASVTD